jgi:osmotically-inducible protein OsmY
VKCWKLTFIMLLVNGFLPGCAVFKETPEDKVISANVRAALWKHEEMVSPASIYVSTQNDVVYLTGLVDNDLEIDDAAEIASQVPGVTRLVNTLAAEP